MPAFYTRESKNTWSATVARRSWSTLAGTCRTEDIGVDRMEIVGAGDRVVVGLAGPRFRETKWPPLKGQIFIVFTVRDGQIVRMDDYLTRAEHTPWARAREKSHIPYGTLWLVSS
jgi:ketosteroid isomerase-like protein